MAMFAGRWAYTSQFQPFLIWHVLVGWNPVVLGEGDQSYACVSQQARHRDPAQGAIGGEIRQPGGM